MKTKRRLFHAGITLQFIEKEIPGQNSGLLASKNYVVETLQNQLFLLYIEEVCSVLVH